MEECPECGSGDLIEDKGEIVCRKCGLVLDIVIDRRAEWRAFTLEEEQKKSRSSVPESLMIHDKGLSTIIDSVGFDGHGRKVSNYWRLKALKLRKWQKRASVYGSEEHNLAKALKKIKSIVDKLSLPSFVCEEAAVIYRKVLKSGFMKGREITSLAAASVYVACRIFSIPRSLKEVAGACGLNEEDVARTYRFILNHINVNVPIKEPAPYVKLIVNRLNLPVEVEVEAIKTLTIVKKYFLTGDPRGLAAGAVYIAAKKLGIYVTQRDLAAVSGVTEVTVRNRFKRISMLLKKAERTSAP